MRHWQRALIFMLFFTAEVRVKASIEFKDRPLGCVKKPSVCTLQTNQEIFHFKTPENEFHLGKNSILIRYTANELEMVGGTLWVEKHHQMQVRTIYGTVKAQNGPFWVLQEDGKIWVRNMNADLKIQMRDGREWELPVGFQIRLGGMDTEGKSTGGLPEMLPIAQHFRLWALMFPGSKEEFKKEVESIKWAWGSLAERSSEIYSGIAMRQQGLADHREKELQKRRLKQQQETRRLQNLYMEKTFFR